MAITTMWRRLTVATLLWVLFWPSLWFFRLGEITGPKAWFWIVGELNYPVAAIAYVLVDGMLQRPGRSAWQVFLASVCIVAAFMTFFYQRAGFSMGVLAEAWLF